MSDTTEPMSSHLPTLSDEAAVKILEFLHELVFRFEDEYFAQIRRFYAQQRDLFEPPSPRESKQALQRSAVSLRTSGPATGLGCSQERDL